MMRRLLNAVAIGCLLTVAGPGHAQSQHDDGVNDNYPWLVAGSVEIPLRPYSHRALDAVMKPAEVLTFTGVKASSRVADLNPVDGYFAALLAGAVGHLGVVYAYTPRMSDTQTTLTRNIAWLRVIKWVVKPLTEFKPPEALDVVFSDYIYHSTRATRNPVASPQVLNKLVFDALKPGGTYVIVDYAALPGADPAIAGSVDRADPTLVRKEVEAAGFVFDAESKIFANPEDPRLGSTTGGYNGIFSGAVSYNADRFMLRFRKPGIPIDQRDIGGPPLASR